MKTLTLIGRFREFGYENGQSLAAARGKLVADHKAKLVAYMRGGKAIVVSPGLTRDVFDSTASAGSLTIATDGTFAWYRPLAYYVERYDVELPLEFVRHVAALGYATPRDVNVRELELPDDSTERSA
jgi:hypothetical protein